MTAVVMVTITDIIIACLFPIFACNNAHLHVQVGELICAFSTVLYEPKGSDK